jgi:hypothetical protein
MALTSCLSREFAYMSGGLTRYEFGVDFESRNSTGREIKRLLTFNTGSTIRRSIFLNHVTPRLSAKPKNGALKITPANFKSGFLSRKVFTTKHPMLFPYKNVGIPSSNLWISD